MSGVVFGPALRPMPGRMYPGLAANPARKIERAGPRGIRRFGGSPATIRNFARPCSFAKPEQSVIDWSAGSSLPSTSGPMPAVVSFNVLDSFWTSVADSGPTSRSDRTSKLSSTKDELSAGKRFQPASRKQIRSSRQCLPRFAPRFPRLDTRCRQIEAENLPSPPAHARRAEASESKRPAEPALSPEFAKESESVNPLLPRFAGIYERPQTAKTPGPRPQREFSSFLKRFYTTLH